MKKLRILFIATLVALSTGLLGQSLNRVSSGSQAEYEDVMQKFRQVVAPGMSIKIQDLVEVVGEESVKLSGFGVVSGLNGTGDSGTAAIDLLLRVARKQGIIIDSKQIKKKNLALVSVSASVGPHQKTFDVAVKSVSDSKSLQNGFLEGTTLTPVGSAEIYGLASGSIALGARYFSSGNAAGAVGAPATVTIGHPTMGFVLSGGELVRDIPSSRVEEGIMTLFVKYPNERTAANIANVINRYMGMIGVEAEPVNASTVLLYLPKYYVHKKGEITRLIADIGDLPTNISRKAVITVDQGSGVIAMTEGVKMSPGSIAVSGLTVTVSSDITPVTRQGMFDGDTDFVDSPQLQVAEDQANFLTVPAGTDLRKVQETLNALKLTPTSIISVFTAMHKAGMIHAELMIIPM